MDVAGRHDFWTAIRRDARRGRTVIFATHYLDEADAYADRVVFVRRGRIVADGTAAEVKALASGRTVRATLPGADRAQLAALPGVDSAEVRGDTVVLHARDTDALARHLLTRTAARDVEITSRNLEEAFLTLTAEETNR
jgi:ABC-2 type transport system ATP-binding protein